MQSATVAFNRPDRPTETSRLRNRVRLVVACVVALLLARSASAAHVILAWDPSPDSDVVGYLIEYGTAPGEYATSIDVGSNTSYQIDGLDAGRIYFFIVKAYNTASLSEPSNELQAIAPAVSVTPTTITVTEPPAAPVSEPVSPAVSVGALAPAHRPVRVRVGGDAAPLDAVTPDGNGRYAVQLAAGSRIAVDLGGPVDAGYQIVRDELRGLPGGSTLDAAGGTFAWQPPVPLLGRFQLVFTSGGERIDVTATIADPAAPGDIALQIDTPAANAVEGGSFIVAGWAVDPRATTGSGIDTLHVWAYRRDAMTPPEFLGAAAVGGLRPDVAAIYGTQFEAAGFTFTVPPLAPGVYDLLVSPWSRRTGRFEAAQSIRVVGR